MKTIIRNGKSVHEVVELALIELDTTYDDIEINVLEEESKGFLGVFGTKEAKVEIKLKENSFVYAEKFLKQLFVDMGIGVKIETKIHNNDLKINLVGEDMALLIGKRGQTLDAIQYLVSLVVNRKRESYIRVVLDTENYREKRKKTLEKFAHRMADKAKHLRKDVILEPMNPYERRIIHSTLQNNKFINTKSDGKDPTRRVIIFFKR